MDSFMCEQNITNRSEGIQSHEDKKIGVDQSKAGYAAEDNNFSNHRPNFDIMDIVMRRQVGGSSEEDSPVKRRKTENDVNTEMVECISKTEAMEDSKRNAVAFGSKGNPDDCEMDINTGTIPKYKGIDLNHSKSCRGLESDGNEFKRSENNLHGRSHDIVHEHISSINRSELLQMFSDTGFENESPDLNQALSEVLAKNNDVPNKCNISSSSEIRVKISPTVYRSKKTSVDNIRKSDEAAGNPESAKDETDGDAVSHANRGFDSFKDNQRVGEAASSYFTSHPNPVSKKSRKQTIPKKIHRQCLDNEEVTDNGEENNSQNETGNTSLSSLAIDTNKNSACQNLLMEGHSVHEKSRKQSIPKRKVVKMADSGISEGKRFEKLSPTKTLNGTYDEPKHVKCRKQNAPRKIIQEFSDADIHGNHISNDAYNQDIDLNDHSSEDSEKSLTSNPCTENTDTNPDLVDDHKDRLTSPYFPNLDLEKQESFVTPEIAKLSQQIALQAELLAKLSQNQIQLTDKFNYDHNASSRDGLEFVKKLREIRVNRYRKISVDVKKHIAAFAKVHGISAAATHFGVSKSAVSLWNRTDFTEKDEELERRKRNCFIGNEKFESLVQRVKLEKSTKFKYLSRDDKVEVAKYAKLVGVREMSRCLNMALGTVSGWMRQFPYDIGTKMETDPAEVRKCDEEVGNKQIPSDVKATIQNSSVDNKNCREVTANIPIKLETNVNIPMCNLNNESGHQIGLKLEESGKLDALVDDSSFKSSDLSIESSIEKHSECNKEKLMSRSLSKENEMNSFLASKLSKDVKSQLFQSNGKPENDQNADLGVDPDLESLIASSFAKPDLDKCYAEVKEQIVGTVLEDDAYFEHLFKRVTATRVDKYKTLKRSEKLEIVRYAKRIGVRRVAKIMDLATGTLSGWIIKYQHLLGLVSNASADHGVDLSNQSDIELDTGNVSASAESEAIQTLENQEDQVNDLLQSPSSILDNKDTTEVTALKFLLKERFPLLQEKINVARKVKFKNLNIGEKLELVKCAKLVGIRPTARVFQMPLGTLSGWISKYSCFLEPEFQGVSQGSASSATSNTWLINHLDNSLGRLNESEITTNTPLITAPHLQWTAAERRSEEIERSESPYSKMMNEMAEKSFSKVYPIFPSSLNCDIINSQTNILNRRLNVDWPKLSSQEDSNSKSELSWPKLKLPNGQTKGVSVSQDSFSFHGYNGCINEETTETMAQQYLLQFGLAQEQML